MYKKTSGSPHSRLENDLQNAVPETLYLSASKQHLHTCLHCSSKLYTPRSARVKGVLLIAYRNGVMLRPRGSFLGARDGSRAGDEGRDFFPRHQNWNSVRIYWHLHRKEKLLWHSCSTQMHITLQGRLKKKKKSRPGSSTLHRNYIKFWILQEGPVILNIRHCWECR